MYFGPIKAGLGLRFSLGQSNETCSARNSGDSRHHPLWLGLKGNSGKRKSLPGALGHSPIQAHAGPATTSSLEIGALGP